MRNIVWIIPIVALLTLRASALEYNNLSLLYTDAPFNPADAAGISLLTGIDAVEGNPDGTFRPNRTLNRAEFLKIALTSFPRVRVSQSDARNCFPDVGEEDWFSRYICLGKKRGIVSGYPDGLFRPGNTVNYAEALKILGGLYEYTAYADPDAPWYTMYAQAAINHKTVLPINLPYDRQLTRGQMARLAAAYRAEYEGELRSYRTAEQGLYGDVNEESSSSESSSVVSEVEDSSSSISSEPEAILNLPTTSHFLVVGERTEPIADAIFTPWHDDAIIRIVYVRLNRKVDSLDALYLVDEHGTEIGKLRLKTDDAYDLRWRGEFVASGAYRLPKGEETVLAIVADLKGYNNDGFSGEIVELEEFSVIVQYVGDGASDELVGYRQHFPQHQTVNGVITNAWNPLPSSGQLEQGAERLIANVVFSGSTYAISPLAVEKLRFNIEKSSGVSVDRLRLGAPGTLEKIVCTMDSVTEVTCLNIPESLGEITGTGITLSLFADIELLEVGSDQTVKANLVDPGEFSVDGSVWWSDASQTLTWVEMEEPVVDGTEWLVGQ